MTRGNILLPALNARFFPEFLLLLTIGILVYFAIPTVYKLLAGGLLFATLLTIISAIFRPKQLSTTVAVLMSLSLTNGLMQFDYIPALTLWLLCFATGTIGHVEMLSY